VCHVCEKCCTVKKEMKFVTRCTLPIRLPTPVPLTPMQPPGPSNQPLHAADNSSLSVGIGPFYAPELFLMDRASAIIQALSKGGCCSCPARSPVTTPLVDPLHMKLVQQALTNVADAQKFLNSALMRQHEAVSHSTWHIRGIKELFELSRSTNSIPFRKPQTCAPKHFTVPSLAFVAMPSTDANQTHFLSARSKLTKQDPDRELDYDSDVQIIESPHLSMMDKIPPRSADASLISEIHC